ncbi:MAG: hypothetical protein WKF48_07125, partial [Solirubrobacteraceae bacterium]
HPHSVSDDPGRARAIRCVVSARTDRRVPASRAIASTTSAIGAIAGSSSSAGLTAMDLYHALRWVTDKAFRRRIGRQATMNPILVCGLLKRVG